jgi:hypothetical protein
MYSIAGKIFDQYDDKDNRLGFDINLLPRELRTPDMVKQAAAETEREYAVAYITPKGAQFKYRIDNPLDAAVSAWYFTKTAKYIPQKYVPEVAAKINQALIENNIHNKLSYIQPLRKLAQYGPMELPEGPVVINTMFIKEPVPQPKLEKKAAKLTAQQRESLPDSAFGLVIKTKSGRKIRKYPMHDENHVRAAITFFNMHENKIPPQYRSQLARKIKQKAKQYGINIAPDNALNKYASEQIDRDFYKAIALREKYAPKKFIPVYEKIASVAEKYDPTAVAKTIEKIDKDAGVDKYWNVLGTPEEIVSGLNKTASYLFNKTNKIEEPIKFEKEPPREVKDFVTKVASDLLNL